MSMNGVEMIAAERQRQKDVEGYDAEHDSNYPFGIMAAAGTVYVGAALASSENREYSRTQVPAIWPWAACSWKPTKGNGKESRMRDLVKAGALIAAEIDKMIAEGKHEH